MDDSSELKQATVNNERYVEVSLAEDQVKTGWPRDRVCTDIWDQLKKRDDDQVPRFMFTDNLMELKLRIRRQALGRRNHS